MEHITPIPPQRFNTHYYMSYLCIDIHVAVSVIMSKSQIFANDYAIVHGSSVFNLVSACQVKVWFDKYQSVCS